MNLLKSICITTLGTALATVNTLVTNPVQATTIDFSRSHVLDNNGNSVFTDLTAGDLRYQGQRVNNNAIYDPLLNNNMQLFTGDGVSISTTNSHNNALVLFNSNCDPKYGNYSSIYNNYNGQFSNNCTGGDRDLATGSYFGSDPQGNVLILHEDNKDVPRTNPDDTYKGGNFVFDFNDENGVLFEEISLLDFDDAGKPSFTFELVDGTLLTYDFPATADGVVFDNLYTGANQPIVTLETPNFSGNNSLRTYKFNKDTIGYDLEQVKKLEVSIPSSGAVTYFKYKRDYELEEPPIEIPEPTSALSLLTLGSLGLVGMSKKKKG